MWINRPCDCVLPGDQWIRFVHAGREMYNDTSYKHFAKLKAHSHDSLHLLILIEGNNTLKFNGSVVEWSAPQGMLIDSGIEHEVRPNRAGAIEYLQITFNVLDEHKHSKQSSWNALATSLGGRPITQAKITDTQWRNAIPDLMACVKALEDHNPLALSGRLMTLLSTLGEPTNEELPRKLAALQREIARDPAYQWTPDTLAEFCQWSSGYLHRKCRAALGCTPMEWVFRLRLEKASTLLIEGSLDLAGIAEMCGFADAYHLSRRFKSYYGIPPGVWRRQQSKIITS